MYVCDCFLLLLVYMLCLLIVCYRCFFFFFFKQKTAYEMRISDWSSDVCSSDLAEPLGVLKFAWMGSPEFISAEKIYTPEEISKMFQIGRASCRERVCQYV